MKTACHHATSLYTGGAEVMFARLSPAMDRRRFENVVVSYTMPGPLAAQIIAEGIRVAAIGMTPSAPASL